MIDWKSLKEFDPIPVDDPKDVGSCWVICTDYERPYICCRDTHDDGFHVAWGTQDYIYHTWTD